MQLGRVDLAEQYSNEALEIERNGADKAGILGSQLVKARIQAAQRHFREAERLVRAVIQTPMTEKPLVWEAQARLSRTADQWGQVVTPEKEHWEALATTEEA